MSGPSYAQLLKVIQEVHAARGDDVCWMDIDKIFVAAGLSVPDRRVGDKEAMLKNCKLFIDNMCAGGKWKSYFELEREVATLQKLLDTTRSERGQALSEAAAHARQVRIADRCPSCGSQSLFIGSGGWITCSVLECKGPGLSNEIEKIADTAFNRLKLIGKVLNWQASCRLMPAELANELRKELGLIQ